MTNAENHIDFDELIAKELAGEIHPEEQKELLAAIEADESVRQRFLQLKKLYNISSAIISKEKYDHEQAFAEFMDQTTEGTTVVRPIRKIVYRTIQIAAVVALFIGIWIFTNRDKQTVYSEKVIAQTEKTSHIFEDSSIVFLNLKSEIDYPVNFSEECRQVRLKGEAFFEVKPDSKKPFIVETEHLTITVLGTSFLVKENVWDKKIFVIVNSGKVKVRANSNGTEVILIKGERAELNLRTGILTKSKNKDDNYLAWKTGMLIFNDTRLIDVISIIENYYNTDIELESENLYFCQLTAKYDNYSLEAVLEMLELTFNITITKTDKGYVIKGESCSF